MYDNFIEKICAYESLMDISQTGSSTQSSLSKLSFKDDSSRALKNNDYDDFAFHTEKEKNPWWQIEFSTEVKLEYIVINNRRKRPIYFGQRAASIVVTVEDDKGRETVIHSGNLIFGCLPDSLPLILPLKSRYSIRRIKLQLDDYNALHLGRIHCLKKVTLQESKGKLIYFANRKDGLGERLRAMLHALKCAKENDGLFYFSWDNILNDFQVTDKVTDIFSKEFINQYYLSKDTIDSLDTIHLREAIKLNNQSLISSYDGIIVGQANKAFKDVFYSIQFSHQIEYAKNLALQVELPQNLVAIHLRAGDIVYGNYRFNNQYYNKVNPIYMIKELCVKLKEKGYQVILFGQDIAICRQLAKENNLIFANDIMDSSLITSSAQRAIFDIVLMSRCEKIFAKRSGFAMLSAFIGDAQKIDNFENMLTIGERVDAFNNAMSKEGILNKPTVGPLLKSFAIAHFLDSTGMSIPNEKKLDLIDESIRLDRDNKLYRLLKSVFLYENKEDNRADELLLIELDNTKDQYNVAWVVRSRSWRKKGVLEPYLKVLSSAMKRGSLIAASIMLIHEFYHCDNVDFSFYQGIVHNTKKVNSNVKKHQDMLSNVILKLQAIN